MKFFKKALSVLLASTMCIPSTIMNISLATETENENGYTISLMTPLNGSINFSDTSKSSSTAEQTGYQMVQVGEDGELEEVENDGSVWAFSVGDIVELLLTPEDGYSVKSFTIKNGTTGSVITTQETKDNVFSFEMINQDLTIESVFESKNNNNEDTNKTNLITYEKVELSDEKSKQIQNDINLLPSTEEIINFIYEDDIENIDIINSQINDIYDVYFNQLSDEQRSQVDASKLFELQLTLLSYSEYLGETFSTELTKNELKDLQNKINSLPLLSEITDIIELDENGNKYVNNYNNKTKMYISNKSQDELYNSVLYITKILSKLHIDCFAELDHTEKIYHYISYFTTGIYQSELGNEISVGVQTTKDSQDIELEDNTSILGMIMTMVNAADETSGTWGASSFDKALDSHTFWGQLSDGTPISIYCGQCSTKSYVSTGRKTSFAGAEEITDERVRKLLFYTSSTAGNMKVSSNYHIVHYAVNAITSGESTRAWRANEANWKALLATIDALPNVKDSGVPECENYKAYVIRYPDAQDMYYGIGTPDGPVGGPSSVRDPFALSLGKIGSGKVPATDNATLDGAIYRVDVFSKEEMNELGQTPPTTVDGAIHSQPTVTLYFQTKNSVIDFHPDDPFADNWTNKYLTDAQQNKDYNLYFGYDGSYWFREVKAPTGYMLSGTMEDKITGAGLTNDIVNRGILYNINYNGGSWTATCNGTSVSLNKHINVENNPTQATIQNIENEYNPEIETVANFKDTSTQWSNPSTDLKAIDTITVSNLRPNQEYSVKTTLYNITKGYNVTSQSGQQEIITSWTNKEEHGDYTYQIEFKFDGSQFAGDTLVFINEIYMPGAHGGAILTTSTDEVPEQLYLGTGSTLALDNATLKHITHAAENQTVTDTIYYSNLEPNSNYIVKGYLMDKATNTYAVDTYGTPIQNTENTRAKTSSPTGSGEWEITYSFDATKIAGKEYVSFVDVYQGTEIVWHHTEMDDKNQSFYIPKITTDLYDKETQSDLSYAGANAVLYDDIKYSHVIPGETYQIRGKLIDMGSGLTAIDAQGNEITATHNVKASASGSGTWTVEYNFDATTLKGHVLVAYEDVYIATSKAGSDGWAQVAHHNDFWDKAQRIYFPYITTTAMDLKTHSHVTYAEETIRIADTVHYEAIKPEENYTLKSYLMDKETGRVVVDDDGKKMIMETTFKAEGDALDNQYWFYGNITPTDEDGEGIVFELNGASFEGRTLVIYEELYHNGHLIADHTDINDENQTVHIPKIRTKARDSETNIEISKADGRSTIIDEITYENVIPGLTYVIEGTIMDKTDGDWIKDAKGDKITNFIEFTPDEPDGMVEIQFELDARPNISGVQDDRETIVLFERMYLKDKAHGDDDLLIVATHEDINDLNQTIFYPRITTTVHDASTENKFTFSEEYVTVYDTITYQNLVPGYRYSVVGSIMDPETGDLLKINSKAITSDTVTFVADDTNGAITIPFHFDATLVDGKKYVVFEELFYNGVSIAEHKDLDDKGQTFYIPKVTTKAIDKDTQSNVSFGNQRTVIEDTLSYSGVQKEQQYTIKGILMNKDTNAPIVDLNGNVVTAEKTFLARGEYGEEVVTFEFESKLSEGTTYVVFEELFHGDTLIAEHKDITDENQTITIASMHTKVRDSLTNDRLSFANAESTMIIDRFFYTGLTPNTQYTVTATVMDKERTLAAGTAIPLRNAHDNVIESTKTFVPSTATGSIDIPFEFTAENFEGRTIVIYCELTQRTSGRTEIIYSDYLNDDDSNYEKAYLNEDETVHFPKIRTLEADFKNATHFTLSEEDAKVIDTVSYENVIPGKRYSIKGYLIDLETGNVARDANGVEILSEAKSFVPQSSMGSIDVTYSFDGRLLEGHSYVLYEELYFNGVLIAEHKDDTDEKQIFYVPSVATVAIDTNTDTHLSLADSVTTVSDTVKYEGVKAGQTYRIEGILMDADAVSYTCNDCGKTFNTLEEMKLHIQYHRECISYTPTYVELTTKSGELVTAEKTFKAKEQNGTESLSFDLDTTELAGKTYVVFERLYHGEVLIGQHIDINDPEQTIKVPKIGTTATDYDTTIQVSKADSQAIIVDTVAYENLIPNKTYYMSGILMDKSTGKALKDANGHQVTAETEFIPTKEDGSVDVKFIFDASTLAGKTVVAFEELYAQKSYYGKALVAEHEDIDDEDQTIHFPKVWTNAWDKSSDMELSKSEEEATIVDTVTYENLVPNKEYTVRGTIYDLKNDTLFLGSNNKPITGETTFTPTEPNGTVDVVFTLNTTKMENKTWVVYEEMYYKGQSIAEHKDPTDAKQTFKIPTIGTKAIAGDIPEQMTMADNDATIIDTVTYRNLTPEKDYTMEGVLMNKETGEKLLDKNGNEITSTVTFTPEKADGEIEMEFHFDATGFEGISAVVFEDCLYEGVSIAIHANINDEAQTIHFPKVWSKAQGNETGLTHVGPADAIMTITDTVYYKNLIANESYHVQGYVMDFETGERAIDANGDEVHAETTFLAEETEGSVDVVFTFDATGMRNKTLVIYEDLYYHKKEFKDYKVGMHKDINDTEQMIHIPEIGTTALDSETKDHLTKADDDATIIDTVSYKNLVPGLEYSLEGILMDKETGEPFLDDFGLEITARTTFTPKEADGTVDITFHNIEAILAAGKTAVAFENLYYLDTLIEHHDDIEDEGQTIHFPKLQTSAYDYDTEIGNSMAKDDIVIVDEVTYSNLIPGKEYTLTGLLMDKTTGEPFIDADGNTITSETTFTPDTADGTVDVIFEVNGTDMDPSAMVVFEELFYNGVSIAEHSDLEDEDQSVYIPWIGTSIVDDDTELQMSLADESIVINDTVKFKNLIPGAHYELIGKLMDKETGKPALDDDGNEIIAVNEFTAEVTQGYEVVTFEFSGKSLEGHTLVAFEELYVVKDNNDLSITAEHKDIDDIDQTIYVPKVRTTLIDNETAINYTKADSEVSLTDTLTYENLMVGYTYTANGVLVDPETETPIVDVNGEEVRATTTFSPKEPNGTVDIVFTFDATGFEGKTYNAFEEITVRGKVVARHADTTDEKQNIHFPKIETEAIDADTKLQMSKADKTTTIVDTVYYENLKVGETYTVTGQLIDKATGEPLRVVTEKTEDDLIEKWTCDQCGAEFATREEVLSHFDNQESCYSYTLVLGFEDDEPLTASTTFTAESTSGHVEVVFEIDTTELAGHTLVAYESLTWNEFELAIHADIEDEAQTIYIPKIGTTALDAENSMHISKADDSISIIDTVEYENIIVGMDYIMSGKLMNKATGEVAKDADGNEITAERTFTATEANGTLEMVFTFDGSNLGNTTLVVFETLAVDYENKPIVAEHTDINDEGQTIIVPSIGTKAHDSVTGLNMTKAGEESTIVDMVYYNNLIVGKTYTMKGVLMNKSTGEALLDADGNTVSAEKEFVAETKDGYIEITFTFESAAFAGETIVAFEELFHNGYSIAIHADLEDEDQTVYVPKITTEALDSENGTHVSYADEKVTIIDTVTYKNLITGRDYTVISTLVDADTLKVIGESIETTITPEESEGSFDIEFVFDASEMAGKKVVVFEDILTAQLINFKETESYTCNQCGAEFTTKEEAEAHFKESETCKDYTVVFGQEYEIGELVSVAEHKDPADEKQTVYIPKVSTSIKDVNTSTNHTYASSEASVVDTVTYENLKPGETYTIVGTLMVKSTGEALTDADGNTITSTIEFTPETANGSVDLTFTFDASLLAGETLVAFEELYLGSALVADHKDIDDEDQSTYVPKIGTTATDGTTKEHMGVAGKTTIVDVVEYHNLIPGTEYIMSGVLMDKETGKPYVTTTISDEDKNETEDDETSASTNENRVEVTFTPEKADGTIELTFDVEAIEGKTIVVFEKLYTANEKKLVASHEDINDESQTVSYPQIKTNATDKDTTISVVSNSEKATIIDKVTYTNLIPGKTYKLSGEIMNKATGKPIGVKANAEFVPTEANGSVDIIFTIDATKFAGQSLVAFEKLFYNNIEIAVHEDLTDKNQTVYIPSIKTNASDKTTGTQVVSYSTKAEIIDTVSYTNLVPGVEYTLSGELMDKATDKSIGATSETTFTPSEANGSVELKFTIDATKFAGKSLVAFETLAYNKVVVATHKDIDDKDQTVYVPVIKTTATLGDGVKEAKPSTKTVLTDVVTYSNLVPGVEYTVKGKLMDKESGKALSINGKLLTAEKTFTPSSANGSVELTFAFDSTGCDGHSIVVYEDLYLGKTLVATHSDINDKNQTVKIDKNAEKPSTSKPSTDSSSKPSTSKPGSDSNSSTTQTGDDYLAIFAVLTTAIVTLGVAIFLFKRRKSN